MRLTLCSALLLGTAACDNAAEAPPEAEISAEEVAAELAKVEVQPGQWEATTEIVSAEGPLPKEALGRMSGQRSKASYCITPEQAKRPDARFLAAQQNSECSYQRFSMESGRLSGRMTCTSADMPGEMVTEMSGQYGPRAYDMAMNMTPALPGGQTMKIRTRTRGERVGECS